MSVRSRERKPWPLRWVLLAIVLVAVPYTYLTLHYRKPGPAFAPHADLHKRANVHRLLAAGFQQISLLAERPADVAGPAVATATAAPGGLPDELRTTLVEPLELPQEIVAVSAAPIAPASEAYRIRFSCTLPDDHRQPGGAELFLKGDRIVIVPTLERVAGDLLARTRIHMMLVTIPAGAIKPGLYAVTLAGARSSRDWMLELR